MLVVGSVLLHEGPVQLLALVSSEHLVHGEAETARRRRRRAHGDAGQVLPGLKELVAEQLSRHLLLVLGLDLPLLVGVGRQLVAAPTVRVEDPEPRRGLRVVLNPPDDAVGFPDFVVAVRDAQEVGRLDPGVSDPCRLVQVRVLEDRVVLSKEIRLEQKTKQKMSSHVTLLRKVSKSELFYKGKN